MIIAKIKDAFLVIYQAVGYKFLALVSISFFAALSESIGIAFFIPLLDKSSQSEASVFGAKIDFVDFSFLENYFSGFYSYLFLIVFFFILKAFFIYITIVFESFLVTGFEKALRRDAFERFKISQIESFLAMGAGGFVNRVTERAVRGSKSLAFMSQLFSSLVFFIVYLGMSFFLDFRGSVILGLGGLVIYGLFRCVGRTILSLSEETAETSSRLNRSLEELVGGYKYFLGLTSNQFRFFSAPTLSIIDRLRLTQLRMSKLSAFVRSAREPLAVMVVFSYLILDTSPSSEVDISSSLVVAFLLYRAMNCLLSAHAYSQGVLEHYGSLIELGEHFPERLVTSPISDYKSVISVGSQSVFTFKEVHFSFAARQGAVIDNANFEVKAGEITAIKGPSGAGKTTVCDLLLGILRPTSGEIFLDGIAYSHLCMEALRRNICYVPQTPVVFGGSLGANIALDNYPHDFDYSWFDEITNIVDLDDILGSLGGTLDGEMYDSGTNLSGGQKQRIAIARALYTRPRLLILDEPTSAIGQASQLNFFRSLEEIKRRAGVIIVSHSPAVQHFADRVLVVHDGQVSSIR